jgi:hypothetical protein
VPDAGLAFRMPFKGAIDTIVAHAKRGTAKLFGNLIGADQMASGRVVVVAGATGYIGKLVVAELRRRGYIVRALVRATTDQANVDTLNQENAQVRSGHHISLLPSFLGDLVSDFLPSFLQLSSNPMIKDSIPCLL